MGKDNILARNSAVFEPFDVSMSITNEEVVAEGNWAYVRGVYEATLTPKAGGDPLSETGKHIVVRKKSGDAWLVVWEIWNSDEPLPGQEWILTRVY